NTAVVYEDETLSYQQLNEKSNQLAHYLIEKGIKPDSLVAICIDRSLEMMIGLLAILKAGGAYVPIDPTYPENRINYMIKDSQASLVLTTTNLTNLLSNTNSQVITLDTLDLTNEINNNPQTKVLSNNLAYVIYTSGTTGNPKGVMVEHNGIVNRLDWMQKKYNIDSTDTIMQKTPFSFDVSVWELFLPLLSGSVQVIIKPDGHKNNDYLIWIIKKYGITIMHFVPSMLNVMLQSKEFLECSTLRDVICSGEALSLETVNSYYKSIHNIALHNLYGPTEASIDVTSYACQQNISNGFSIPIGKPINNTQLYILDKNNK
ncbi:MAG: amino acid adenylation domain-containing protein, partial [Aureispira sp.]|nr:amino acid adenylation domain-containing protein [Aureispira sp.]